ncbi:MAG: GIY-YIG nuclease family protein [Cyanobacteria bacterium Co-bin8]|nr:GIY-YIG nuclease family protein [Cyanobacteria bacterium Co-bin8]
MTSQLPNPTLESLEAVPYLTQEGLISEQWQGKVGIYAIYDAAQSLQYVGYSRDVYLSLKQHLVRQPDGCHWIKVQLVERPSRTLLEEIRNGWIEQNGSVPPGNGAAAAAWNQPIDAKLTLTEQDKADYAALEEIAQIKYLKQLARRVEAELLEKLKARGVQMDLRFNPKLKEEGLLDLK